MRFVELFLDLTRRSWLSSKEFGPGGFVATRAFLFYSNSLKSNILVFMMDHSERLAKLEERVFTSQAEDLKEIKRDLKSVTTRLEYLILALTAMFGLEFLKLVHGG